MRLLFVRVTSEAQLTIILVSGTLFVNRTLTFVAADVYIILNVPQSVTFRATREGTIVLGVQMAVTKIKNTPLNVCEIIIEIKCHSLIA